jgi:CheY-like chemotaxis protein
MAAQQSILVVEDDEELREVLEDFLQGVGYRVLVAPDGEPALERMRTHPEGLVVLLDFMMPGMDGYAALQALSADAPTGFQARLSLHDGGWKNAPSERVAAPPATPGTDDLQTIRPGRRAPRDRAGGNETPLQRLRESMKLEGSGLCLVYCIRANAVAEQVARRRDLANSPVLLEVWQAKIHGELQAVGVVTTEDSEQFTC